MADWLHQQVELESAASYFRMNGFVAFSDVLTPVRFQALKDGVEAATAQGLLTIGATEVANNNDCIFAHDEIMKAAVDPEIVGIAERLIGHPVELQHSKFNAKPLEDKGGGAIDWHQDYPFYPHSNYDLVSCILHLDDEEVDSGPIRFINGSHKWGPTSHLDHEGNFAYRCTDRDDLDRLSSSLVMCKAGMITFHHGLTMHSSAPKARIGHRRYVIFQYRAVDAVQLAGVLWKSHGLRVSSAAPEARRARFADGTTVELRGKNGRLFDLFGQLAPDRSGN